LPQGNAIFLLGIHDDPKSCKKFLNHPIATFFERTGVTENDLWPNAKQEKSMWNAKLYTLLGENDTISQHLWMQDTEQ